jgi:hypothetical protein
VFCGAEHGLSKHRGRRVCSDCLAELRADVVSAAT